MTYEFRGSATTCVLEPKVAAGTQVTYYVRARDVLGNYSASSLVLTKTIAIPNPVLQANISLTYAQSSKSNGLAVISWTGSNISTDGLPIAYYEITAQYTAVSGASKTITDRVLGTVWEVSAEWNTTVNISIVAVDISGNRSTTTTKQFTKDLPSTITGQTITVIGTGIEINWPSSTITATQLPIAGYELRTVNQNFGFSNTDELIWRGTGSKLFIDLKGKSSGYTFTAYLKPFNIEGEYSNIAAVISYTVGSPQANITISDPVFEDTSLTAATFTLNWTEAQPVFGLDNYRIQYTYTTKATPSQQKTVDVRTKSTSITLPANWLGSVVVNVSVIDGLGNQSTAQSKVVQIQKPNMPTEFRAQVIDNNVLLYWTEPQKTTLPIAHVRLKRSATTTNNWNDGTLIGDKDGTFTNFYEQTAGNYRYWIVAVDTENNESDPQFITVEVDEPPNYVFIAEQTSSLSNSAGLVNAVIEQGSVVLPVNLTETWTQHFTTRSWASPQAQVTAGFPVYVQPGTTSGSYTETFDFGATVFAGVQITTDIFGSIIAGNPQVTWQVETSQNNTTWTTAIQNAQYILTTQNFRYVRVKVTVTQAATGDIYRLTKLYLKLDSTKINNSGAATTNAQGIADVNFTKDFFDVSSINVSVSGTTPLVAVYNFQDSIRTGNFSVSSATCTITTNQNHEFKVGYKVRVIFFGTGTVPPQQTYLVATVPSATQFTISLGSTAYTGATGTVEAYPNSMEVRVFDQAGTAQASKQISWYVEGY